MEGGRTFLSLDRKVGRRTSLLHREEVAPIYSLNTESTLVKNRLWEYLKTVVGALVFAVLFTLFIGRAFTVDGPSMMPTLQGGERLIVDQLTYRFRPPQRGEIIVFRYPAQPSHFFIKRVIGLPGDEILIRGGRVFVNGRHLVEGYTNGAVWGNYGSYVVPEDHYFVLGDNRNNSQDSRNSSVGSIPTSSIIGRAIIRYWPLNRAGILSSPDSLELTP